MKVSGSEDHDEKGGKLLRQQARARTIKNVVAILGSLFLMFVTFVQIQVATPSGDHPYLHHRHEHEGRGGSNPNGLKYGQGGVRKHIREAIEPAEVVMDRRAAVGGYELPDDSIYRLTVFDQIGDPFPLMDFAGKVTLIVNTACKWGKTELSFTQLEELREKYEEQGFEVLAFPITDFHQEFKTNGEIQQYIQQNFPEVQFPILSVSSLDENPVYKVLRKQLPGQEVHHNFFKYLVDRQGVARKLFTKKQDPLTLGPEIEDLLKEQPYKMDQ